MNTDDPRNNANTEFYGDYYHKPWWWFRFRYDTQIKRKTILWLLRRMGVSKRKVKVLEIGFGSGVVLFSFDRTSHIAGIEVSESAVAQAIVRAKRLGFTNADFRVIHEESLPFPGGMFDVVIASHVLEHVREDGRLLSEMHRILNDKGVAIILVPINEQYSDPKHVRSYSEAKLVMQLATSGFVPCQIVRNELLFHLVERFYFGGYKEHWGRWGVLTAALFNVPAALLPFPLLKGLDIGLSLFGLLPRQCGIAAVKISTQSNYNRPWDGS
jgi:ubiquinone/menaquinone biosynthesis C-methylase UbiE